ncbi:MAG TPA: hypothetical protein VGC79_11045, partial [Polyangiaceae bacterium]
MLWVALATAIMLLSGELSREADDGKMLARLLEVLRKSTIQDVPDAARKAAALRAIRTFELGLEAYRRQIASFKACIAEADGRYGATRADYDACQAPVEAERAQLRQSLVTAQNEYEASVTEAERTRVAQTVMATSAATLL